jgi:hypothetical protein
LIFTNQPNYTFEFNAASSGPVSFGFTINWGDGSAPQVFSTTTGSINASRNMATENTIKVYNITNKTNIITLTINGGKTVSSNGYTISYLTALTTLIFGSSTTQRNFITNFNGLSLPSACSFRINYQGSLISILNSSTMPTAITQAGYSGAFTYSFSQVSTAHSINLDFSPTNANVITGRDNLGLNSFTINIPSSLQIITLFNNNSLSTFNLTGLGSQPSFTTLQIYNNSITGSFNYTIPNSTTILQINNNAFSNFTSNLSSTSLTTLRIDNNQITTFTPTAFPATLTTLLINKNRITSTLPTLVNSITNFQCNENLLTVSSIPNLPNSLITLVLGSTTDSTTYRNNFTTLFTSNYTSMTVIQTITASNCGLTIFTSRFGAGASTTLITLNLSNQAAGTTNANTFSSIDCSNYTALLTLNLSYNTSLTTISNLNSSASLSTLQAIRCLLTNVNYTFPNSLKTIDLSENNFGNNFTSSLSSLTGTLNLKFRNCGLTSTRINQILNDLVTGGSLNGTLDLGNPTSGGGSKNFNSDTSSGGFNGTTLRNTLCSSISLGGRGWTCTFCDSGAVSSPGGCA